MLCMGYLHSTNAPARRAPARPPNKKAENKGKIKDVVTTSVLKPMKAVWSQAGVVFFASVPSREKMTSFRYVVKLTVQYIHTDVFYDTTPYHLKKKIEFSTYENIYFSIVYIREFHKKKGTKRGSVSIWVFSPPQKNVDNGEGEGGGGGNWSQGSIIQLRLV